MSVAKDRQPTGLEFAMVGNSLDFCVLIGSYLALWGAMTQFSVEFSRYRGYVHEIDEIDHENAERAKLSTLTMVYRNPEFLPWIPQERLEALAAKSISWKAWLLVVFATLALSAGSLKPFIYDGLVASSMVLAGFLVGVIIAHLITRPLAGQGAALARADHAAHPELHSRA